MKRLLAFLLVLILTLSALNGAFAATITKAPSVSATVSGKEVKLTWTTVPGALSYEVECYTRTEYDKMVKENGAKQRYFSKIYGVKTTQKTITVSADGEYVFQVAAVNATSWKFSKPVYVSVGLQTKWLHGIPVYKQTDSRWSGVMISTKNIGQVGCLVTSMAMCESYRAQKEITPKEMRDRLSFTGNEMYWPSDYKTLANSLDLNKIYSTVKEGKPVIVGAQKPNGGWHWVIVTGYQNANPKKLDASMFSINDPNSTSRTNLAHFLKVYSQNVTIKGY